MPTSKGRAAVDRYFDQAPEKLMRVLRGAARAGATVIEKGAEDLCRSDEVRAAITTATRREEDRMLGLVQVKGSRWIQARANWLEYGTSPHFISVDDSQRRGRSVGRINSLAKDEGDHSLVIGGKFVGKTVFHPGAQAHPFMRTSLDLNEQAAVAEAQRYLNVRVGRSGITGGEE